MVIHFLNSSVPEMGVSENRGTPKSSILIGFSIINHPFWGTSIVGNSQITPGFSLVAVFFPAAVGSQQPPSRPLWTDVMSEVQRGCIGEADWLIVVTMTFEGQCLVYYVTVYSAVSSPTWLSACWRLWQHLGKIQLICFFAKSPLAEWVPTMVLHLKIQ